MKQEPGREVTPPRCSQIVWGGCICWQRKESLCYTWSSGRRGDVGCQFHIILQSLSHRGGPQWEFASCSPIPTFLFELKLLQIPSYNSNRQVPRADNSPLAHHEHQGGYFQINSLKQNMSIVIELGRA